MFIDQKLCFVVNLDFPNISPVLRFSTPNVPKRLGYLSLRPNQWHAFDVDWPEFDLKQESYMFLGKLVFRSLNIYLRLLFRYSNAASCKFSLSEETSPLLEQNSTRSVQEYNNRFWFVSTH